MPFFVRRRYLWRGRHPNLMLTRTRIAFRWMMLLLLLLLLLLLVLVVLHMVVVGGVGADAVVAVSQLLPLSQLSLDFPKPYAALGKSALNAAVGE